MARLTILFIVLLLQSVYMKSTKQTKYFGIHRVYVSLKNRGFRLNKLLKCKGSTWETHYAVIRTAKFIEIDNNLITRRKIHNWWTISLFSQSFESFTNLRGCCYFTPKLLKRFAIKFKKNKNAFQTN